MSIGDAAKFLGAHIDTLRRWDESGKLLAEKTAGGTRRYRLSTLRKFQDQQQNKVSITDAAEHLGVSVPTLRRWDKSGKLPTERNASGERVYNKAHLESLRPLGSQGIEQAVPEQTGALASPSQPASQSEAPETTQSEVPLPSNKYEDMAAIMADPDPKAHEVKTIAETFDRGNAGLFPESFSAAREYLAPVGDGGIHTEQLVTKEPKLWSQIKDRMAYLTVRKTAARLLLSAVLAFLFVSGALAALPLGVYLDESIPGNSVGDRERARALELASNNAPSNDLFLQGILAEGEASNKEFIVNADTVINGTLTARGLRITGESQLNVTTNSNIDQDLSTTSDPTFTALTLTSTANQITSGEYVLSIGGSGTIVTTDASQTLTNKTIDGGSNTLKNIPNSALSNAKITINTSGLLSGGGDVALGDSLDLSVPSGVSTSSASCVTTENGIVTGAAICPTLSGVSGTTNYLAKFATGTSLGDASIYDNGNIGIGTTNPTALFTVGSGSAFTVDTSGNITTIRGVAYSFPNAQGAGSSTLINDGSGNLSWQGSGGSGTLGYWQRSGGVLSPANSGDVLEVTNFRMPTGATNNYVLTTDGSGNASWTDPNGGSFGAWTLTGNTIFANQTAYQLLLGSTTVSDAVGRATIRGGVTGKAAFVIDETGDQNILTASKSGVTKFYLDNTGNVNLSGTNIALNGGYISGDGGNEGLSVDSTGLVSVNLTSFNPVAAPGVTTDKLYNLSGSGLTWAGNALCNASGNCNGTGSNLGGSGGANYIAKWSSTYNLSTSLLYDTGTVLGVNTVTPLAILDVRGTQGTSALSGTIPVASISGLTAKATLVVDNNGVGDLFTASKSGATKFVITNSGNVGVGTTNPSALFQVNDSSGAYLQLAPSSSGNGTRIVFKTNISSTPNIGSYNDNSIGFGYGNSSFLFNGSSNPVTVGVGNAVGSWDSVISSTGYLQLKANGATNQLHLLTTGAIGMGTSSPVGRLDVRGVDGISSVASISGTSAFASLVVDNNGVGDLFTASKSGATKFVVTNSGNVGIGTTVPFGNLQISAGNSTTVPYLSLINPSSGSTLNILEANMIGTSEKFHMWLNQGTSSHITLNYNPAGGRDYSPVGAWDMRMQTYPTETYAINYIDATGTATRLFINSTGSIGLGTTTPVGRLDVRAINGTSSVASISGSTAFAGLVVDNSGVGDIFTASASGLNRFVITNGGNVGVGTTVPSARLSVNGISTRVQDWLRSSDNGVLGYVSDQGQGAGPGLGFTSTGHAGFLTPSGYALYTNNVNIQGNHASVASLSVFGAVSQAADLQKWITDSSNPFTLLAVDRRGLLYNPGAIGGLNNIPGSVGVNDNLSIAATSSAYPAVRIDATTGQAAVIINQADTGGDLFTASAAGVAKFVIDKTGNVGIGTSNPTAQLSQVFAGSTTNGTLITGNGLSTGNLFNLTSTSIALSTGKLVNIDWSPAGATSYSGNLVNINVGGMATISGQIFNIQNNGSDLFQVNQSLINANLPVSFNAPGDVAIAYDINFTNPTASFVKSSASLYLTAGKNFNSDDLGLLTYNKGNVVVDSEAFLVQRAATVSGQLVLGASVAPANIGNLYLTNSATFGKALAIFNQTEGADIFAASASGTNRFVIQSGGNVGIGTSVPSNLLQVAGGATMTTATIGTIGFSGSILTSTPEVNINSSNAIKLIPGSGDVVNVGPGSGSTFGGALGFLSTSNSSDVFLRRDAANTLAQRNGTSAQVFRVYNTFTSATNYELGNVSWSSNIFTIGTEKGSGGGTARNLALQTDGTTRLTIDTAGNVGIGSTSPTAQFNQVFTGNTTNGALITGNGLSTGNLLSLTSTSIALTTGKLLNIDFSPGGATTYTGNLVNINVGGMATISGQIFNVQNNGSDLFSVNQSVVTANLPVNFTSPGDVGIAYDLSFTNPVSSYITSNAPLSIVAGKLYNSSNLTLSTYNVGNVIVDSQALVVNQAATISGQLSVSTVGSLVAGLGTLPSATVSGQTSFAAFVVDNKGTGDLFTASSSGLNRFVIKQNGGVGIGSGVVGKKLDVRGAVAIAQSGTAGALDIEPLSNGAEFWTNSSYDATNPTNGWTSTMAIVNGNVGVGTTTTSSQLHVWSNNGAETGVTVQNTNSGGNPYVRIQGAANRGVNLYLNGNGTDIMSLAVASNSPFAQMHAAATYGLRFYTNGGSLAQTIDTNGNVGIGSDTPVFKLDLSGSQSATGVAQLVNTNTGADADGLIVKLGFTGTGSTTNSFVTFLNGNGEIHGLIRSSGSSGVAYVTSGIADFGEWLRSEVGPIEPGTIVCHGARGVRPCDNTDKIAGVVSDSTAFLGGVQTPDSVIVGFVGQVSVKVASASATIRAGDSVTVLANGEGERAQKSGMMVGHAVSDQVGDKVLVLVRPGFAMVTEDEISPVASSLFGAEKWNNLSTLSAEIATISDTLKVVGRTELGETTIGGTLTVGLLHFDDLLADLSATTGELSLQHGAVKVRENGEVAGTAAIRGVITLEAGSTSVVSTQHWSSAPVSVVVTPSYETKVWIENLSKDGFTVKVSPGVSSPQKLYWQALW